MAKIKKLPPAKDDQKYRLRFFCPACNSYHTIDDEWGFDGNYATPTLSPSIMITRKWFDDEKEIWVDWNCHSYIKNGEIEFLNDCSHELAGKTVELPGL